MLRRLRKSDEAEQLLRETLASARAAHGAVHPEVANISGLLAGTLEQQRRLREAEEFQRIAYSTFQRTNGEEHPLTAGVARALALNLMAQDRGPEAESFLREAQHAWSVVYRYGDADATAHVTADLGLLLGSLGRVQEGEKQLLDAIAMYRRLHDDDHKYVALAQTKLADILLRAGRTQEALQISEEADSKLVAEPVLQAYAASVHASALARLGRIADAEALVPELRPPDSPPPTLKERVMMARALELYSSWAPKDASEALKAQLITDEYLPINLR
jgi:tetratricopeptide (TPR) repeat protein